MEYLLNFLRIPLRDIVRIVPTRPTLIREPQQPITIVVLEQLCFDVFVEVAEDVQVLLPVEGLGDVGVEGFGVGVRDEFRVAEGFVVPAVVQEAAEIHEQLVRGLFC